MKNYPKFREYLEMVLKKFLLFMDLKIGGIVIAWLSLIFSGLSAAFILFTFTILLTVNMLLDFPTFVFVDYTRLWIVLGLLLISVAYFIASLYLLLGTLNVRRSNIILGNALKSSFLFLSEIQTR